MSVEMIFENLIGRQQFAIDSGFGEGTNLTVPSGCVIGHQKTSTEDSVLSSFSDTCSIAISFEADKPILSTVISMTTVEGFRMEAFQESFRN